MAKRLTVSESCKLVGKSESTIKRMLREIVADPTSPERSLIDPPHEEVARRKAAGDSYVWHIDTELLLKRYPPKSTDKEVDCPLGAEASSTAVVIEVLQEQMERKDEHIRILEKQLDRKDMQIENLSERQRESNLLMKTLQEKLAIAPPKSDSVERLPWWRRKVF